MMRKFLLAALVTLLGLSTAVQAVPVADDALVMRDTNAARFARGMPPLPPVKRSEGMSPILYFLIELPTHYGTAAKRTQPSGIP
jgi:hypothetical protein